MRSDVTHFQCEIKDRIATVRLDRPDRKNPLTFDSYAELRDWFRDLVYADDVDDMNRELDPRGTKFTTGLPGGTDRDGHGRPVEGRWPDLDDVVAQPVHGDGDRRGTADHGEDGACGHTPAHDPLQLLHGRDVPVQVALQQGIVGNAFPNFFQICLRLE